MFRDSTISGVWNLCGDVASNVYPKSKAPTQEYRDRVQHMLFMLGAHESLGFIYRRQMGFGRFTDRGAFSLWQVEWNSIEDSIHQLTSNFGMSERVWDLFRRHGLKEPIPFTLDHKRELLELLQVRDGDIVGCVLARLHLLRCPGPIPETEESMAVYAKQYYNTKFGKATPELYLQHYRMSYSRLLHLQREEQAKQTAEEKKEEDVL